MSYEPEIDRHEDDGSKTQRSAVLLPPLQTRRRNENLQARHQR